MRGYGTLVKLNEANEYMVYKLSEFNFHDNLGLHENRG